MKKQRKKVRLIFFSFGVLLVTFYLTISPTVQAIEYGGFGGRPAYPRPDSPRSDSIFIHTLEPGARQEEGVVVINNTEKDRSLMVYSADSTPSSDGGFACRQVTEPKEGVGSWITFGASVIEIASSTAESAIPKEESTSVKVVKIDEDQDSDHDGLTDIQEKEIGSNPLAADTDNDGEPDKAEYEAKTDLTQPVVVNLAARSNILIPFVINMPPTAGVGEHDGCILIQEKKQDKLESGISLATRTGMRVSLTVPGEILKRLEIMGFEITNAKQNGVILKPTIRNSGNVSVDADIAVAIKNIFGGTAKKFGGMYSILREDTASWNFEMPDTFWGGYYQAQLSISYDDQRLKWPTQWFFLKPQPAGLAAEVGTVVLILGLLFLWWFKRRQSSWIAKTWKASYRVKANDDLHSIAAQFGVNWKLLARVNKMRAPYTLRSGASLRVPPKLKRAPKIRKVARVQS